MRAITIAQRNNISREERFAELYCAYGDPIRAAVEAGYAPSYAKDAKIKLLMQPHIARCLQVAVRKRFAGAAPMALRVIEHLAQNELIAPRVRLDAARTLLDRAGHVAPRTVENTAEAPLHELSTDALKALASRLEGELAGRAKPVISATAAPEDDQDLDI